MGVVSKTTKFVASTMFVSATFMILGYIAISYPEGPDSSVRMRGISYLALLPYLVGALINREGYWEWSKNLDRSHGKRTSRTSAKALQIWAAFLLVCSVAIAYLQWGSIAVRSALLLALIATWVGIIRQAWLVHKRSHAELDSQTFRE